MCLGGGVGVLEGAGVPTKASMATRPCLSSASRQNFMFTQPENPKGSKPCGPCPSVSHASGRPRGDGWAGGK